MATSLNTKIVLKNTTKMTLNERFTAYRAQAATASNYRQKLQMQRQASSANLRLAQQMANRPTVIAALRIKKRSLQQRLGRRQQSANGNIKSRLNFTGKRLNNQSVQGRLGSIRGRGGLRRGSFKSGTSPLLKDRLGLPKSGFKKKQLPNQRGGFRKRGNFRGGRQSRGRGGSRQQVQRSNLRNARGRGRGKSWWNNRNGGNVPSKQELDNQLDEYMAETKSSLDAQLEHYMSQG